MMAQDPNNLYKDLFEELGSTFKEDLEKDDKDLPKEMIRIMADNGKKEISIRVSEELFFNTLYDKLTNDAKMEKYELFVEFLMDQEESQEFFRYVYLIRQRKLSSKMVSLNTFIHKMLSVPKQKPQQLFNNLESTIVHNTSRHSMDVNFQLFPSDSEATPEMEKFFEKDHPKTLLGNVNGIINQNPLYTSEGHNGMFQSTCQFQVLINNKYLLKPQLFTEKAEGMSKGAAEDKVARKILTRIWNASPALFTFQKSK